MTPKPPNTEQELAAVKAVLAALDQLDPSSRMRVMRAAEALLPPPQLQPPAPLAQPRPA